MVYVSLSLYFYRSTNSLIRFSALSLSLSLSLNFFKSSKLDVVQTSHQRYLMLPSKVRRVGDRVASIWREKGKDTSMRISLLSSILSGYEPNQDGYKFLRNSIDQLVAQDGSFFRARVAWFKQATNNKAISRSNLIADYLIQLEPKRRISSESYNTSITISEPWLRPSTNVGKKSQFYERLLREASVHIGSSAFSREELIFADWSPIYYSCELKKWLMSFSTLIIGEVAQNVYTIRGLISVDVDVSATDFDQCQGESTSATSTAAVTTTTTTTVGDHQAVTVAGGVVVNLPGSHKCEEKSSLVSTVTHSMAAGQSIFFVFKSGSLLCHALLELFLLSQFCVSSSTRCRV